VLMRSKMNSSPTIYCRIITIGIISFITIASNIFPVRNLNKRVVYYSWNYFDFLDYSVWKMYQPNFFIYLGMEFFKSSCDYLMSS
jgi:hypothetical protein